MKKVRSFRVSDENYDKIKNMISDLERKHLPADDIFAKHKKRMSDILVWCYENDITIDDIKEAFAVKNAVRLLKEL